MLFLDATNLLEKTSVYHFIDKNNPEKILLKLDNSYDKLLTSSYKKYNLQVGDYWITPEIAEKIQKRKKNLPFNRLMIEKSYEKSAAIAIPSFNENITVFIKLTDKDASADFLSSLVCPSYQVVYTANSRAEISRVLERVAGFSIKLSRFTTPRLIKAPTIAYYSSNKQFIEQLRTIQKVFEKTLDKTPLAIQKEIKKEIIVKNIDLFLLTSNKENNIIKTSTEIIFPRNVKLFENYAVKTV